MSTSLLRRGFLLGRTSRARAQAPVPTAAISRGCLAQQAVSCQLCRDACDAEAIRFSPTIGRVALPIVDPDRCTGCGDCVPSCPVNAIAVCEEART